MEQPMHRLQALRTEIRRLPLRAVLAAALAVAPAATATAQQVVVIVNGTPITNYDVEQRAKFIQMSTKKAPPRQEVIQDLIDEKLKIQYGKRYKLEVSDNEVDSSFAEMGRRMRLTPQQLTQALAQGGVDTGTLKNRIRADIAWQQMVRGRYQASMQVREKDVMEALLTRKKDDKDAEAVFDYVLRPILFVVPRGSPEGAVETRRKEAEALRGRFQNCQEGLPFARALRDTAVREQIVKSSSELPPPLRKILDDTAIGHLTPPETTAQGIELFALCAKRDAKADSAAKRQVQNELFAEQFQEKSKRLLLDLRRGAMIEVK
jgi:peptidyl-prolyl cis-trans isomerase SurA